MKQASMLMAVALFAATSAGLPAPRATDAAEVPALSTAHGALFGAGGRQITVTLDFVRNVQQRLAQRLRQQASPSQRVQFDERRLQLAAWARGDTQAELYGTALLLEQALHELQGADAARWAATNAMLLRQLAWRLPAHAAQAGGYASRLYQPDDFLQALWAQTGLRPPGLAAPAFDVLQQRELYQKQCTKAGVPVPPAWGSAGWKAGKQVTAPFIITDKKAQVFHWTGTRPAGVCLALPRFTAGNNSTSTLGIICMGEKTVGEGAARRNSACFWDWEGPGATTVTGAEVALTEFAAGPGLNENVGGPCSDCHAGNNAYIVHPEDQAFEDVNLPNLASTGWYLPLVKNTWPQNPFPTNTEAALGAIVLNAGEGDCTSCHRLPEMPKPLNAGDNTYCLILGTAVRGKDLGGGNMIPKTMPPSTEADDYSKHINKLNDLCRAKGVPFLP